MEQRNELLRQMKLSERQKKGDVQHLLSRSFSRKSIPAISPMSPPGEITLTVPQFPMMQTQAPPIRVGTQPIAEEDAVSIGELSVEPRLPGHGSEGGAGVLIDLSTEPQPPAIEINAQSSPSRQLPHPRKDSIPNTRHSSHSSNVGSRKNSPPTRTSTPLSNGGGRKNSRTSTPPSKRGSRKTSPPKKENGDSSSDDSCPEEQSVRTPLLDGEAPPIILPATNTQPSIRRYDDMFTDRVGGEDEIPLGGTADTLNNKP